MSVVTEDIEQWQPPTESLGRVPLVTPGKSGDKHIKGDFPLDQIVIDQLPPGTQVHSCDRYGASAWAVTARIETTLANGGPKDFFLKCADGDQGKAMLEGEYNSMVELYKTVPNFVPDPYTWGKSPTANGMESNLDRLLHPLVNGAMQLNREINGEWKDLEECVDSLIKHVIPRLLVPLTTDLKTAEHSLPPPW